MFLVRTFSENIIYEISVVVYFCLKIISTFLNNNICIISYSTLSKELKNSIEI